MMNAPAGEIRRIWARAMFRLLVWLGLWALAGLLISGLGITLALLIGLSLYTAGHLVFAYQLHRWLAKPRIEPREGFGVWQEIYTELYRLKQRNRRRKRRLKDIVSEFQASTAALPDGAVVIDARGRIVWFNEAAAALLKLRAGQDNGQRIANLIRHPRFANFMAAAAIDGDTAELEIPSPANETDTVLLRIVPYGDRQRLLIARDISEQKRLEFTRRDFVANASHELRTPLTVLRGYLEMMSEEAGADAALADWQRPIREMENQSARMGHLIDSLLRLARLEGEGLQQRQENIDVSALVTRLVEETQRSAAGAAHRFEVVADEGLALFGRPGEIESVITNLLGNAVRYSASDTVVRITWASSEQGATLAVSDEGPGIAAEHIPRLTERFYRVDAGRRATDGGTGLGLAIVKHGVEHHESELVIDSTPGQGTTFRVVFPQQRVVVASEAAT
ncbi:phosphate regulon sensor histidine kinase PhoR [Salinisphaera sp. Q1T1-3]|uniref:phosphate regulon sensor histidine kinase PhoR n=1 Tax=Salinisphaera sp. Q1T1-3 TaxID=2321229 RepID=UPI000E744140|nr:phosphate regulon sensor histidine kinase PhoR [Salinisphaera sp. Q1T1-3]RJS95044.1 phosphate regulon sensor histidine kinase PhoR [Salinisphaera sp. Q1T1-3]